jgi:peptidoglycan/xylan/chitin deacetylase (PgdA/CDA1 family)
LYDQGAIIRGDTLIKNIALVFTGDQFADGAEEIIKTLTKHRIKASFFFTGNFYRNQEFRAIISHLKREGHYLGAHSDQHLLYCAWHNRDSLLVTTSHFENDVVNNYREMSKFGIEKNTARYFLPPYEWYNDSIATWTKELGYRLINYTPGTKSHADYTTPDMEDRYVSSNRILNSIITYDSSTAKGLNGFILLSHIGTHPLRTDKFYFHLDHLISYLMEKEYKLVRIDELLM